jgi:hypothetical protein
MPDIGDLLDRVAHSVEPAPGGLEGALRRVGRRRRRRRLGTVALALAVATAGVSVPLTVLSHLHAPPAPAVRPPVHLSVGSVTRIPAPGDVVAGEGSVWVRSLDASGTLWRLDPRTGRVLGHVDLGPPRAPFSLAVGDGSVWTINADGRLVQVDVRTLRVISSRAIPQGADGIATGFGSVWVTCCGPDSRQGEGELLNIDLRTDEVAPLMPKIPLPGRPGPVATGFGSVWVVNHAGGVWRVDPATRHVISIPLPWSRQSLAQIAVGAGAVWGIDRAQGVFELDPSSERIGLPIRVPGAQMGLAAGAGAVWVNSGPLVELDPMHNRVLNTLPIWAPTDTSAGIAVTARAAWIADQEHGRVVRVVFSSSGSTCVSGWEIAPKPQAEGVDADHLVAASAASPNDVWAVGTRFLVGASADQTVALIEHWDGTRWTAVPGADLNGRGGSLTGVAALAPDDVWAVGTLMARSASGHQDPLIEHWDGNQWSVVQGARFPPATPMEPQGLEAIVATSPDDVWILGQANPVVNGESVSLNLYEHWDGHQWSLFEGPQVVDPRVGTAAIQVISADPAGDAWAAGGKIRGFGEAGQFAGSLVELWDGSRWVEAPSPPGDEALSGLAVVGPQDVWVVRGGGLRAVGTYGGGGREELLHWDGTGWESSTVIDGTVNEMAARGPDDVWAVGSTSDGAPLIQHWDGHIWNQLDNQAPDSVTTGLVSASVAPTGVVVAFGSDYPASLGGGYKGASGRANNYLWVDCG